MSFGYFLITLGSALFVPVVASDTSRFNIDSEIYDNVIVISDCHGDYTNAVKSLYLGYLATMEEPVSYERFRYTVDAGVSGDHLPRKPLLGRAVAARTVVVQLGDLADRGDDTKVLFTLFERLPAIIGWRTETIIGNHELMAHRGDIHDSSRQDLKSFGGKRRRNKAFSVTGDLWRGITARSGMVIRFGGAGESTAVDSADTLFVHAGVDPSWLARLTRLSFDVMKPGGDFPQVDIDKLNTIVRKLGTESESDMFSEALADSSSPVWTRIFSFASDGDLCDVLVPRILKAFNVARVVVGHQAQESLRVGHRCDKRIVFSDVKISRSMPLGGQPTALLLKVDAATGLLSSINGHYWTNRRSDPIIAPLDDDPIPQKIKPRKKLKQRMSVKRAIEVWDAGPGPVADPGDEEVDVVGDDESTKESPHDDKRIKTRHDDGSASVPPSDSAGPGLQRGPTSEEDLEVVVVADDDNEDDSTKENADDDKQLKTHRANSASPSSDLVVPEDATAISPDLVSGLSLPLGVTPVRFRDDTLSDDDDDSWLLENEWEGSAPLPSNNFEIDVIKGNRAAQTPDFDSLLRMALYGDAGGPM